MAKQINYTCDGCGDGIPNEGDAISMMGVSLPAITGTTTRPFIDGVNLCKLDCVPLWVEAKLRPRIAHERRVSDEVTAAREAQTKRPGIPPVPEPAQTDGPGGGDRNTHIDARPRAR